MAKKSSEYTVPVIIAVVAVVSIVAFNLYLQGVEPVKDEFFVDESDAVSSNESLTIDEKSSKYLQAPDIRGISGYINTDEDISIQKLVDEDKVVLVDFWTYTCINCQRTLPHLKSWHDKYSDDGLVILGVHTPEFDFEKDYDNVLDAVERFEIEYPVVQDNDYETWRAYQNRYWPRKYIVDIDGYVRYDHIGEGAYDETEEVIKSLLAERAERLNLDMGTEEVSEDLDSVDVDFRQIGTPEIYFGSKFLVGRNYLGNFDSFGIGSAVDYTLPEKGDWRDNFAYLGGAWRTENDFSQLESDEGRVGIRYVAKVVNIVASGTGEVTVFLDGEETQVIQIDGGKLYNVVSLEDYGQHELELVFTGDVQMFTFTFG